MWAIRWLRPGAPSLYTRLDRNRLTLGRGDSVDVSLDASAVSREHATLTRQGPVFALADAGSTNGTFVNAQRVRHAALAASDVVRLGDMIGVVTRVRPSELDADDDVQTIAGNLFGPDLAREVDHIRKIARTTLPVVVIGETGVGKEAASRALHELSGRSGPFHSVNCAALPASLAEAELFGHRKGAFTGAEQPGTGHLRAAHGGTLLLYELADLALPVQAKLLRALQDCEVVPLGETRAVRVDLRIVAACQTPLAELVQSGRLREDLAMRLAGSTVQLKPLRERRIDTALLIELFLQRGVRGVPPVLEARALERLLLHVWPGNVRELEHFVRRLVAFHPDEAALRASMLPDSISGSAPSPQLEASSGQGESRDAHDRDHLAEALRANGGNMSGAASAIGISRQRAYRLLGGRSVQAFLGERSK